jgi:hypothetical protein
MGGAVGVPGNIGPGHERAEWNLWIDPVAAREVLRSGIPVTLVGLDATNDVPVTAFTWNALRRYRHASTAATVAWDVMTRSGMFMGGQYFWDPLAATAVVRPGMLRFADRRLDVVTAPGADTGRVVETTRGALVRLAIGADRAAFERQLMRTLTRRPRLMLPKPPRHPVLTCDVRRCSYAGPHRATTGQGAFETVNDASTATTYVFGRLIEGRTIADLRRYVRGLGVLTWRPPSWFAVQATGTTPPHSTMTWVVSIPRPGDMALLATTGAQTRVVAPIRIRAAR